LYEELILFSRLEGPALFPILANTIERYNAEWLNDFSIKKIS
jgi:hypothetical protein